MAVRVGAFRATFGRGAPCCGLRPPTGVAAGADNQHEHAARHDRNDGSERRHDLRAMMHATCRAKTNRKRCASTTRSGVVPTRGSKRHGVRCASPSNEDVYRGAEFLDGTLCHARFAGGTLHCGIGCVVDTTGATRRFTDNGDGTVIDDKTALQ
jgi:hypothetical protein